VLSWNSGLRREQKMKALRTMWAEAKGFGRLRDKPEQHYRDSSDQSKWSFNLRRIVSLVEQYRGNLVQINPPLTSRKRLGGAP